MPQFMGKFDGDKAVDGLRRAGGKKNPTEPKRRAYAYPTKIKPGFDGESAEMEAGDIKRRRLGQDAPLPERDELDVQRRPLGGTKYPSGY